MMQTIDTILTPLTWGVSGILALWHWLFPYVFGTNGGDHLAGLQLRITDHCLSESVGRPGPPAGTR